MIVEQADAENMLFLRALVLLGLSVWISTESLGALHLIRPLPLLLWWIAVLLAAAAFAFWKRRNLRIPALRRRPDPIVLLCAAGVAVILALTALAAWCSPPNSADAMAYHLPRVVYWAEQASVRFFPTPYFNQIMLQPFAEYWMLQTYVLSGGDRFINLIPWFASLGCTIGISLVAKEFGAAPRGQAIAALFCATLPAGILASSGAKNDYVLALWLIAAVFFALRFAKDPKLTTAFFLGAALGLALFTKATGYLFAPFVLAAIALAGWRGLRKRLAAAALLALPIAVLINSPLNVRNFQLSGSIFGFDSAQGDGVYRWRNETFGWRPTVSNALRNVSDQLGQRSDRWNRSVYRAVLAAHQRLGIAVNDPGTTWPGSVFTAPVNANHEANAPNPWHLLILCIAILLLTWRGQRAKAFYAVGLLGAFLAFCFYLKWQPDFARLLLPLFVLSAPLASEFAAAGRRSVLRTVLQTALCLFLLNNARHAVLENWVRPLTGPRSVLKVPRDAQYFADMTQWNNRASYQRAVDLLEPLHCGVIGLDITDFQLEYPLQALLRERHPTVEFLHTGVRNASARYAPPVSAPPCAIVCFDCIGDAPRLALYDRFPVTTTAGRFVIRSAGTPLK
jgi:4-amino-4-deoxy-L-arabinose transferase-like glycosyltransferase